MWAWPWGAFVYVEGVTTRQAWEQLAACAYLRVATVMLFLTVTRDARRFAYAFELSTCLQCDDNRADPVRRARDDATADGDGRRLPGALHSIGI